MESVHVQIIWLGMGAVVCFMVWKLVYTCYVGPIITYKKLQERGFRGPTPSFPLGNLKEMKKRGENVVSAASGFSCSDEISHDIHPISLPYFAKWKKLHGKVFMYWMGTEPFLYIAEPEFLKQMSAGVLAKIWGKPLVFTNDRIPMFGRFGLNASEGNDWARHRHIITPAFSPAYLKAMTNLMVESTTKVLEQWGAMLTGNSTIVEVNVEREFTCLAGEIISKTNFGIANETGKILLNKLKALHSSLFTHTRYVGVPFGQLLSLKQTLEARRLGKEVDDLILSIINARKMVIGVQPQHDLIGLLLEGGYVDGKLVENLPIRELIDECKTFFFAGHETVALAMTWTLLLLALYPTWQDELRKEIEDVIGDKELDFTLLAGLKKLGWVMNEVLRLYPSSPNAQRQAREDIRVGDSVVIPRGTNIWIDLVSMHHDQALWGDDANEFKPERFSEDVNGGCKHKMGYLPFGFGGRMCIGKNYAVMEYKIVLSLILSRFSFSLSPSYHHFPIHFFSLKPRYGVPLIIKFI